MVEDSVAMSTRATQWTNAPSPASSLSVALKERLGSLARLEKGIRVTKITTRGVFKQRVVTVSSDRYAVFVTHQKIGGKGTLSKIAHTLPLPLVTRKGLVGFSNTTNMRERYVRYIDVADLNYVQTNVVGTHNLEAARKRNRLKGLDSEVDTLRGQIVTIGHHGGDTLDLIVADKEDRAELLECIRVMIETYRTAKLKISNEAMLFRHLWYDIDVNQDGLVSEQEYIKLLNIINFHVKRGAKEYKEFKKAESITSNGLTYSQLMGLIQSIKRKFGSSMSVKLWNEIFGANVGVVDAKTFLDKFVHEVQGETTCSLQDVETIFRTLNEMEINVDTEPPVISEGQINRERFEVLLHHNNNGAFDPFSLETHSETALNKPISMYWVNTSHNTYLTGDQLRSTSSVEMYLVALRRGCKCLELDCWDGETTAEGSNLSVIFHGHTLTSKILFADVILAVKRYMDENPDTYPVILSLENHCSHPFQKQMAADMKGILGNLLYVPNKEDREGYLPSPESLRGKVIIKGKRPPETEELNVDDVTETEGDEYDPYDITASPSSPSENTAAKQEQTTGKDSKPPKIVKELTNLTLFHGAKFKHFEKSLKQPTSHMHSISEPKISKILKKSPANSKQWPEYNIQHLTRTYPAGTRVDSSNYNPVLAWALGCQLVALNFQTNDVPLILNDGLFRQNQGCGYLLKPSTVLLERELDDLEKEARQIAIEAEAAAAKNAEENKKKGLPLHEEAIDPISAIMEGFNSLSSVLNPTPDEPPSATTEVNDYTPMIPERLKIIQRARKRLVLPLRLKIKILSGSCLPKPKGSKYGELIDPYVSVTVHDVKRKEDGTMSSKTTNHTTSTVSDNGFCPVWDDAGKEFVVENPQVAMIHFSLSESDIALDDKVADAAIPLSCLRKGYRSIQLYDKNGGRSGLFGCATLLVHIERFTIQ